MGILAIKIEQINKDISNKKIIYEQKLNQYNTNNSNNISEIISISSSNEYSKSYENGNYGIFTKELLQYLNDYGNFNILNAFDIFTTTNLKSTFLFDKEPILLL